MRDRALLPAAGRFYKANLHCHTVLSDGRWAKEQVKAEYQRRGYSIVAFTDHRHYGWHPELMDDGFVPLAAYEADLNEPFPPSGSFQRVRTYHLNFYDTDPVARGGFEAVQPPQRYGDMEALNAFIARMNGDGFLCCYNHPYWSLQNCTDYQGLQGVFAMEIYNHGCELDGLYGYAPQAYDEMLRAGQKLFCVATDDNHDVYAPGDPRCDSFGGFTMFKLEKLTYASVIEAMKKGDFYASNGPEIQELSIRDGALCVRCSPVEKIYVVTSGRRCLMQLAAPRADPDRGVLPPERGRGLRPGGLPGRPGPARLLQRLLAGRLTGGRAYICPPGFGRAGPAAVPAQLGGLRRRLCGAVQLLRRHERHHGGGHPDPVGGGGGVHRVFRLLCGGAVLSGSLNAITYLGAALATWGIGTAAEGFGWGAVFVLWAVMAGTALAVCLLLARPWGRFVRECETERGDLV